MFYSDGGVSNESAVFADKGETGVFKHVLGSIVGANASSGMTASSGVMSEQQVNNMNQLALLNRQAQQASMGR